jgi:hypothetical protein
MLILDYGIVEGKATPTKRTDERTGVKKRGVEIFDNYFWIWYDEGKRYLKTPFRSDKRIDPVSIDRSKLASLLSRWAEQLKFFEEFSQFWFENPLFVLGKSPFVMEDPLYEDYLQVLLCFVVNSRFAARKTILNFANIVTSEDVTVQKFVNDQPSVTVRPIDLSGFLGCSGIYLFDENADYKVTIGDTIVYLNGKNFKGLLVGFLIKPSFTPFVTIDQLVNNGWLMSNYIKSEGRNTATTTFSLSLYTFVNENSIKDAIDPFVYTIQRTGVSSSLDIEFGSYVTELINKVPEYFEIKPSMTASFEPITGAIENYYYRYGIKRKDFSRIRQESSLLSSFKSRIITVLNRSLDNGSFVIYHKGSLDEVSRDTKGLFVDGELFRIFAKDARSFFGVPEGADVYKEIMLPDVPDNTVDSIIRSGNLKSWFNMASRRW